MNSISIALCTFNGERYLDAQLNSLRQQQGVEEIVVVDDDSTDDTMALLYEHAVLDRRIRIFQNQPGLGVIRNFERAIGLVRGSWVALADQDDIWVPEKIAKLRSSWNGQAVLLHHATLKFSGTPVKCVRSPARQSRKFAGGDLRRLLYRNTIVGHTTIMRTDVAKQLMPFPSGVPHDWWLGAGAVLYGEVQYVDEYLVHYRIHDHNAYHRAGSRFNRLRSEHELRLNLLQHLEGTPRLTPQTRSFVSCFRQRLEEAATNGFPWKLAQFYLQHAGICFGGTRPLSGFTRVRKSFAATCGAVKQGRPTSAISGQARCALFRFRFGWASRFGLGALLVASLTLAVWPSAGLRDLATHSPDAAGTAHGPTIGLANVSAALPPVPNPVASPPPFFLQRDLAGLPPLPFGSGLRLGFGRPPQTMRWALQPTFPPPAIAFHPGVQHLLIRGPMFVELRRVGKSGGFFPGQFRPVMLHRNLRRRVFRLPPPFFAPPV